MRWLWRNLSIADLIRVLHENYSPERMNYFTSVKSQSGDGVRRFKLEHASLTDGEQLGSSGITANLGDVGPYVPV